MVILIGGASHTGKTSLAQKLLNRYGFPYLSIDHLKMGLIRSRATQLTPLSDGEALTDYLWPVVREIIKTAIENEQNLIIEGCYIPFDWAASFDETYLSEIRYVCLAMSEDYIRKHYTEIMRYAGVIEKRLDDSNCTLPWLIEKNKKVLEKCRRYAIKPLLIEDAYRVEMDL